MKRRGITVATLFWMVALATGCGTMKAYDGPALPETELAFVVVSSRLDKTPFQYRDTVVESIDGKAVDSSLVFEEIAVLPGLHTLTFEYQEWVEPLVVPALRTHAEDGAGPISFEAQAGHVYEVRSDRRDGRLWSWVVDISTGHAVGGEMPAGGNKGFQRTGRRRPE
jgi:hypothetical protein